MTTASPRDSWLPLSSGGHDNCGGDHNVHGDGDGDGDGDGEGEDVETLNRNVLGTRNLGEILSQRDSIAMEMQVVIDIITSIVNIIIIILNS